jgi:quercetin dioxygenase-like cupin family protein
MEKTMRNKAVLVRAAVVVGIGLAFGVGVAIGQGTAPTETKGVKVSPPTVLDLTQEIDSVQGRQLRLRLVTLESGGVVGIHTHNGRPGVAYVLQGTLTEHLDSGEVHERHEGESWTEGKGTTHWAENKGDGPLVVLAVDVFKP